VTPQHEDLVGIGVDAPVELTYPRHQQDPADTITGADELLPEVEEGSADDPYLANRGVLFSRRHRLHGPFVLYPGRVEPDNGCEEMLEYFDAYAAGADDPSLVLMGVKMLKVPESPYVRLAGVLPDRERMTACEAATATIAPAPDDLLSQSLLESLAVGTPVLVNARNRAAVDQCRRSNAGLYYANREEFVAALTELVRTPGLRERLGESGRRYVRQHHQWEHVIGRFEHLVSRVRPR
jgi:glycosyltransferase involved in cell wall biosynthesis